MLENHLPERHAPPVYTPEELSWLTGIPDGLPPEIEEEDRPSLFALGGRRGRIDAWLDLTMERLIAMRDALDASTEDMEDDDPHGDHREDMEDDDQDTSVEDSYGRSITGLPGVEMIDDSGIGEGPVDVEAETCGSLEECAGASYAGTDYRCGDPMDAAGSLGWANQGSQLVLTAGRSDREDQCDDEGYREHDLCSGSDQSLDKLVMLAHRGWRASRLFPVVQL